MASWLATTMSSDSVARDTQNHYCACKELVTANRVHWRPKGFLHLCIETIVIKTLNVLCKYRKLPSLYTM